MQFYLHGVPAILALHGPRRREACAIVDCRLSCPLVLGIVHFSKASALPTSCTYKRRENGELMKTPLMRVSTYHQKFNHNTRKKKKVIKRGLEIAPFIAASKVRYRRQILFGRSPV